MAAASKTRHLWASNELRYESEKSLAVVLATNGSNADAKLGEIPVGRLLGSAQHLIMSIVYW